MRILTANLLNVRYTLNEWLNGVLTTGQIAGRDVRVEFNKPLDSNWKLPIFSVNHYQAESGAMSSSGNVGKTSDGKTIYGFVYNGLVDIGVWVSRKRTDYPSHLEEGSNRLMTALITLRGLPVNNYSTGTKIDHADLDGDDKTAIQLGEVQEIPLPRYIENSAYKDVEGRIHRLHYWVILKALREEA